MNKRTVNKINKALADEFGKDIVKVVLTPDADEWGYVLKFKDYNPPQLVIERATQIVDLFEPTLWLHDKWHHTEEW